jgi:hypothetical protein
LLSIGRFWQITNTFPPELASILVAMMHKASMPCNAFVALPALVLLGYGWFIRTNYWPYLDARLRLRSPDLAELPEDVIGFGFWMWWPFIALLFTFTLTSALSSVERRGRLAAILVSAFALLSAVDYYASVSLRRCCADECRIMEATPGNVRFWAASGRPVGFRPRTWACIELPDNRLSRELSGGLMNRARNAPDGSVQWRGE